jgi:hypothetical protein
MSCLKTITREWATVVNYRIIIILGLDNMLTLDTTRKLMIDWVVQYPKGNKN